MRILAAEDNPMDARLLRMAFEEESCCPASLVVAKTGEEALAYLLRRPPYEAVEAPDLVILDLNLPGYDGVEILRGIRNHDRLKGLPVMILSSSPRDAIEDRVRRGNVIADGYFSKPSDLDEYLAVGKAIQHRYDALAKRGFSVPVVQQ